MYERDPLKMTGGVGGGARLFGLYPYIFHTLKQGSIEGKGKGNCSPSVNTYFFSFK